MSDKNKAVIDFLNTCPQISGNPLFFNFINAKNNNKQFVTVSNDVAVNESYIDGSVLKRYTFNIIDYKSVTYNPIVKREGYPNENMSDMSEVQQIADWLEEQSKNKNFPDFGENCIVQDMKLSTNAPDMRSVNSTANPPLAQYIITIRIEYLDTSGCLYT